MLSRDLAGTELPCHKGKAVVASKISQIATYPNLKEQTAQICRNGIAMTNGQSD